MLCRSTSPLQLPMTPFLQTAHLTPVLYARQQGYTQQGIACWSGNDDEAHSAVHDHGASGVISVTSNVVPGLFAGLMRERDDAQNEHLQVGRRLEIAGRVRLGLWGGSRTISCKTCPSTGAGRRVRRRFSAVLLKGRQVHSCCRPAHLCLHPHWTAHSFASSAANL